MFPATQQRRNDLWNMKKEFKMLLWSPNSQLSIYRMCWTNKSDPRRPHIGPKLCFAKLLVPDATRHVQRSCGVHALAAKGGPTWYYADGFNVALADQ